MVKLFCLLLALWCALPVQAEIYKYRDDKGRWHFSDKPFEHQRAASPRPAPEQAAPAAPVADDRDLSSRLKALFRPGTPIESVTLAVVSIETPLGVGSGFFVTDDGYLLTNKHVVRPSEARHWEEAREQLAKQDQALIKVDDWLTTEGARLRKLRRDLNDYRKTLKRDSRNSFKQAAQSDYDILEQRYQGWKAEHDRVGGEYKGRKRLYDKALSDFRFKTSASKLTRSFKVILKDATELQARLVKLSEGHDLALLKVDDYRTPRVAVYSGRPPAQGLPVFAVGSPLGMRDHVTAGIVTSLRAGAIVTDTQILPGNSGGPLVNESGEVLGINTQKLFRGSVQSEGFGIAIPIGTARSEFEGQLKNR